MNTYILLTFLVKGDQVILLLLWGDVAMVVISGNAKVAMPFASSSKSAYQLSLPCYGLLWYCMSTT